VSGPPLRVAFDVTSVISGRTGIARYTTQLSAAIERHGVELCRYAVGRATFALPSGTRHLRVPARVAERWWRAVPSPPIERLVGGADLVHATGMLAPPATRLPLVMTVHDIAALRHEVLHPPRQVRQLRRQIDALARASAILAVSRATADDLADLGVARERIVVAPLGVTLLPEPRPPSEGDRPAGSYLLTVGESSPRKRYDLVLRALALLEGDLELVMAGPPADDEPRLRSLAHRFGLESRVRRVGPVSDTTLAGLYDRALALCFPSVAEGFGLPVLEAMAAGLPVVTSDLPVIRELAGDAAVYVDGQDEQAWTEAIHRIASDDSLRARVSEAGRRRASEFTWERTAARTLEAYRLALEAAS